ncbi:hypothetical protein CAEBREN_12418 [Caenorhabditis brenneri]|uniref:Partial AB-hydrolase lipase domain-containing protein n=1 Tax=Caenorhabditis brenneri TaxID=135651 RepID=G0M9K0_CAEBE|nr:hypothetical protein CAEBREN_12418 [Caenorhabditis brenneri]
MINRWGYPVLIYTVETTDGYILELHRIPYGKTNVTWSNGTKPVVFMQHGLLGASSDWTMNLPGQSAAFIFADAGFDVWLGNMRGNTYCEKHKNLKPSSSKFWQWSWDEMASYDLPAMINKVLEVTGEKNLYYMGHSQGTLTMFSHLSKDDGSFAKKIKKFFALAPIGSGWFDIFGTGEFLPSNWAMKLAAKYICDGLRIGSNLCNNVCFLIAGPKSDQWNSTRVPVYASHDPAGTSTQNIIHWIQMVRRGEVPAYDWGSKLNKKKYGQANPPLYDFTKIKGTEIYLYWSDTDWLADEKDVTDYLLTRLNPDTVVQTNYFPDYNHFDFVFGLRAATKIYKPIVDICTEDYNGN